MRSLERVNIRTIVRTYVRTYSHTYVRDRPYIPSTTLLCEGIIISVKNDNDLTARQLLRVIEIQIFRSDFETAAYNSMRSLFPQLSIEC